MADVAINADRYRRRRRLQCPQILRDGPAIHAQSRRDPPHRRPTATQLNHPLHSLRPAQRLDPQAGQLPQHDHLMVEPAALALEVASKDIQVIANRLAIEACQRVASVSVHQ